MCRANSKGQIGRRCPSHTEPSLIDERNEVRREQYANKKVSTNVAKFLTENKVKFTLGKDMSTTYFQGTEYYDPEQFKDVKDHPPVSLPSRDDENEHYVPLFSKPATGGLWTAPGEAEDGKVKTTWTDWAYDEGFRDSSTKLAEIKIRPHAVIVTIDNNEDAENLVKTFPNGSGNFSFEKMKEAGIDGLHLSSEGNRNSKRCDFNQKIKGFNMWDMESTVWISPNNIYPGAASERGEYASKAEEYSSWDEENHWENEETYESGRQPLNEEEIAALRAKLMNPPAVSRKEAAAARDANIVSDESLATLRAKLMDPNGGTSSPIPLRDNKDTARFDDSFTEEDFSSVSDDDLAELRRKLMG